MLTRAGFDPDGHSGKALVNVLENYPRDELFQIDEDTLYQFALAVLQLDERPRVRVLPRRDRFDRFVSVLVYVPRDRYDSDVRKAIGDYLAEAYNGRVSAFYPFFPEGPLVRVHFIIGRCAGRGAQSRPRDAGARGRRDRAHLERRARATSSRRATSRRRRTRCSSATATPSRSATARPIRRPTRSTTSASSRGCPPSRPLGVDFHRRADERRSSVGLKVWSYDRPIPLSERVPVLENMGFRVVDERTYQIARSAATGLDGLVPRHAAGARGRRARSISTPTKRALEALPSWW